MNILVTICARGGSKGVPKKNISTINGKPLIAYSIEAGQRFLSRHSGTLALSTDDDEIKAVAAAWGLTTSYVRPSALATDQAGKVGVIRHLWQHEEATSSTPFDLVLDLDVSSPLRTQDDLEQALAHLESTPDALNLFSVSPARRNPYFNMVEPKNGEYIGLVKEALYFSRQSAPPVYDINGSFYFYRRNFLADSYPSVITERTLVYVMPHLCFDVDEPLDLVFLDFLLSSKQLPFMEQR
ncbi:N-acylneuraminate cytidylyltransferase [Catalinimonas alkaloidigena]|uniref:N-acylneuraminate cytidylyltransferase n=1 Tax=Catalinimonas alkaloidigena TaxID=1075417 RepID=A0A1G8ZJH2_9BACT|nr:acylneuraminate cytidylyltransferase family protein [Catalinimonas alkaloidigena]SDK15272.1 N-acylneuraminate cytidylyltransferase [Catalinimonas alkaloidigena]